MRLYDSPTRPSPGERAYCYATYQNSMYINAPVAMTASTGMILCSAVRNGVAGLSVLSSPPVATVPRKQAPVATMAIHCSDVRGVAPLMRVSVRIRKTPAAAPINLWTAEMPAEWFVGYNPFIAMNFSCEYNTFVKDWSREETAVYMLRRGMLIADGVPLKQVNVSRQIGGDDGAFFVQDPGLQLHFRLPGDADPEGVTFEVTTQEQVFAPKAGGVNYIRVSGLCCQHAADGFPIPQRAMISAARGHHWIIEDCDLS